MGLRGERRRHAFPQRTGLQSDHLLRAQVFPDPCERDAGSRIQAPLPPPEPDHQPGDRRRYHPLLCHSLNKLVQRQTAAAIPKISESDAF